MTIILLFVLIRRKQYPLPTVLLINFFVQRNRDNMILVHAQKKPNVVKCVR